MTRETRSTCPYCGVGCGVIIESSGDEITGVRGDPDHPGMLSYAVLDTDSDEVEVVRFSDRGEHRPAEISRL